MRCSMEIKKRLTAHLGYFEAEVWVQVRDDGTKAHRVTVRLACADPLPSYQPMEFVVGTAEEVLDILEVADASNALIESIYFDGPGKRRG